MKESIFKNWFVKLLLKDLEKVSYNKIINKVITKGSFM